MIKIQECCLCAFKQHVLTALQGFVNQRHGIGDVGSNTRGDLGQVSIGHFIGVKAQPVVHLGKDQILFGHHCRQLFSKDRFVEQVLNPQSNSAGFIGIRGANSALRGPELVLSEVPLNQAIQFLVIR